VSDKVTMVLGRRWVLKQHFNGLPKKEDFELVEEELPALQPNQFVFRSKFISVDPYQRPYTARMTPPLTMIGSSVATIEESRHPDYPVGADIIIYAGWVERGIASGDAQGALGPPQLAPKLDKISSSHLLGACGMPGNTAYFGFLEICQPKPGNTVVVSGAAGAVGSLVGQIAKIKGCKVIGYAGTDKKCEWLKSIGFDFAFNYKTCKVGETLKTAAPEGVDCYFDNVGGEMSASVMAAMNTRGRVSVCGAISHYNDVGGYAKTTDILPLCVFKELRVEGFIVVRWISRWMEGITAMAAWMNSGDIKVEETVVDGFENTPDAFMGLFSGKNTGKMVVKI